MPLRHPRHREMGLALLLAAGALLAVAAAVTVIVRDARAPDRATIGWALARGIPTSPADMGWASAESAVHCADGTRLPAWTIEGGTPDGPCLLLIHGWRRSRIDSLRRLPWMLPHVRAAVVPDLRGHGDAPEGPSTLGVQDVEDMLRAMRGAAPSAWVVAGHSLGAAVALRVASTALDHGITVQGVLLLAPYSRISVPLAGRLRSLGLPAEAMSRMAASVIRWRCGRETPVSDAFARIGRARVPIVCVSAEDDHIVPPAAVRDLAREAAPAGCDITVLNDPDASHDTLGTAHPAWASAAADRLLSRPPAAATTS